MAKLASDLMTLGCRCSGLHSNLLASVGSCMPGQAAPAVAFSISFQTGRRCSKGLRTAHGPVMLQGVHAGVLDTHQAVTAAKAERAADLLQSIVQDERFQWLVADCETNFSEKFRDFCSGRLQVLSSELTGALPSS